MDYNESVETDDLSYGRFISSREYEKIKQKQIADKKAEKKKIYRRHSRILFSIGMKLVSIISLIVIISLGGITFLVSYFVSNDTKISAEENNLTINSRTATDCENRISSAVSSVGMFFDLLEVAGEDELAVSRNTRMFFDRNKDLVAVALPFSERKFQNQTFFLSHEIDDAQLDDFLAVSEEDIQNSAQGRYILRNASPFFKTQTIAIFYSSYTDQETEPIVIIYSSEALSDSFTAGSINLSYLVNGDGEILLHPDIEMVMSAADFTASPIVQDMQNARQNNGQVNFTDAGEDYIGAFKKISLGDCGVITIVKTSVILEAVRVTTRRNIYLTIAILSIAILIVWFFSKSLSAPLTKLKLVTDEINRGNFNTDLFDGLKTSRKDEIGVLIRSTRNERQILNTFTKLTNKGVTKAIIRKEIDFNPHLKDITIFFSDIRGFTAISDGFKNRFQEQSAAEIISFLNDYMSRMVNCITITGGTVDKFEGDAIMACWGVLRDDSLEFEKMQKINPRYEKLKSVHDAHVKEDALNAIKATVAMRYALMKYNKDAEAFTQAHSDDSKAKYKPHIRIGCGINSGRATVGFMGSYDKMEFTSIGDAVNLASRTESSNKPCGTDMLITEDTYNLLKMDYIKCEENEYTIKPEFQKDEIMVEMIPVTFEVKGKGKQHFYGVVNMPQFDIKEFFSKTEPGFVVDEDCAKAAGPSGPVNLGEVRTLLGIPEPNFDEVNLDAEENKIQIKGNTETH